MDDNSSVTAFVNATNGAVGAQYSYDPFGKPIRTTGPVAAVNSLRFSTKYHDDETDTYYYGYRHYAASSGDWPNRDPLGERGGQNLYGFVHNNPVSFFDRLGLETVTDDIWVKSNYKSKKITGPVGTKCCRALTGEVKVDFAYIKATLDEKMGENHQDVIDYITTAAKTTGKAEASIQASSYLGAGFGITFTPSANAKNCCTKIYWEQRLVQDGQYYVPGIVTWFGDGIGGVDYKTSGATAVDFPGDTVSGIVDRDFGRTFLLTLFCDKQDMFSFTSSYHVNYNKTTKSATVTLDFPF